MPSRHARFFPSFASVSKLKLMPLVNVLRLSLVSRFRLFAKLRGLLRVAPGAMALPPTSPSPARIVSVEDVATTQWLKLQRVQYTDARGQAKSWDRFERTTKRGKDLDSVAMITLMCRRPAAERESDVTVAAACGDTNGGDLVPVELLLVRQFRAGAGCFTIEFPAGIIDENETPEQTAVRELLEETGEAEALP
eukprot:GHVT01008498.1.p1 GENE.GHVT01008498.1~~GHVT01008498.1.p1  ORF type:complete len:194 (+),score=32.14 GHVT01008498.1:322-903(+)